MPNVPAMIVKADVIRKKNQSMPAGMKAAPMPKPRKKAMAKKAMKMKPMRMEKPAIWPGDFNLPFLWS